MKARDVIGTSLVACMVAAATAHAQPRPSVHTGVARGQNVVPVYEGWIREADGSISMIFGYFNRNYEEVVDIPVGPANSFDGGPADRGQPTHFLPRRHQYLFRVPIPADWPADRRLIWTLASKGKTERAQGWLQPEWEMDEGVFTMNLPRTFARSGSGREKNKAPSLTGVTEYRTSVSESLKISLTVTDDGNPRPAANRQAPPPAKREPEAVPTASAPTPPIGLLVEWIQWRGPGRVTFAPARQNGVHGQPLEAATAVRFSQPGTYVVRATAHDGALFTPYNVTVVVSP